jgi:broad specificity phosphatase PhoE
MGRLLLIRHAQASFLSQNYDKLSDLGEKQARLLGEYWAKRNTGFDRAWTGPCVRHKDTARLARDACVYAGLQFPEPVVLLEFDEYQGDEVLQRSLPRLLESSDRIRELHKAFEKSNGSYEKFKTFQKMFEAVISMWVDGKISPDGVESWTEFSIRVNQRLTQILSAGRHGERVVVFTSGGPIALAAQRALQLTPQNTLQVSWMSQNCSVSEFLFSKDRFTLSTFNSFPHLGDSTLQTYR